MKTTHHSTSIVKVSRIRRDSKRSLVALVPWTLTVFAAISASAQGADIRSVSKIAFGPPDTLFIADWEQSRVHALSLPPAQGSDQQSKNLVAILDGTEDRLSGEARLANRETRWEFTPASPWSADKISGAAHPRLEAPCGDEIGEAFEHTAGSGLGSQRRPSILSFFISERVDLRIIIASPSGS